MTGFNAHFVIIKHRGDCFYWHTV